ncbi:MAG: aminotransferase class I/II-fold pyridoxal phosphate-dependent enzyme [Candidatus Nanopelagicales bacterium]|jgi:N-succinyldiaminopimelate aminotransferase|nr:aminotransferase class I/II-fold pyridoxal phosphate-dependent enzyme [Candidatus Nanopelagicales bacterium]
MRAHRRSIFGEMSALAAEVGAVNLGQGFPDTEGPALVRDAAIEALRTGRGAQYPPAHGLPELRAAIADHQRAWYGLDWDPRTDVVVTTGASEAIAAAILALVEPGDEVLVLEPWFDLYAAAIDLAGARRVAVPPVPGTLRPDPAAIAAAVTPRSRMLVLNSPHNPTGVVLTADELAAIAGIAAAADLVVLADEAYEHLWFDGHPHVPIATLPGMAERTVTVGSAGKSLSFTGWKVGWATGPAGLIGAVRVVRQHLSYVSGGPFQWAVAQGLTQLPAEHWEQFRAGLAAQRDLLAGGLAGLGLPVLPSEGTYFLLTDVRGLGYDSGERFCAELPGRAGVVAIPVAPLCEHPDVGQHWVRWAFCKQPAVLEEALQRLTVAFG